MKIKVKPQDFIVEEITEIEPSEKGEYAIFKLKKEGVETLSTIKAIASKLNLNLNDIGYAGIKDRYAQTTQYITIKSQKNLPAEIKGKNYYLKLLGYTDKPIKTGNLKSNKFTITLRELSSRDISKIQQNISLIKDTGIINYYDSQRFGSTKNNIFIAKFLFKKDYRAALKQFILSQYEEKQKEQLKQSYDKLIREWKNFGSINLKLPYLDFLQKEYNKTKDWKLTYKKIPKKLRELIIMSYQSYLWNECIKEVILKKSQVKKIDYNVGTLYFPTDKIEDFSFPLIGRNLATTDENIVIINKILEKEQITLEEIKQISKSGNFLKSAEKQAIISAGNIKITNISKDEIFRHSQKLTLSFELPKGSYATIVIKQITL